MAAQVAILRNWSWAADADAVARSGLGREQAAQTGCTAPVAASCRDGDAPAETMQLDSVKKKRRKKMNKHKYKKRRKRDRFKNRNAF